MNFSATAEYSLRIASFLAMDETRVYTTNDLFEHLNIPFRYLRKLMVLLSKSDLIDSIQGKNGGYRIAKPPKNISLLDVIEASGVFPLSTTCFFGFKACSLHDKCAMHAKWVAVRENLSHVLSTTTLAEIKDSGNQNFITDNSLLTN